jgi:glycosyltransferase involved in cell wall biosynthesis
LDIRVNVIIPALNEENAVGKVIEEIPNHLVEEVIVIDNGSKDSTFDVAKKAGATALLEPVSGYGRACLKGMDYISKKETKPDIIVFLDGDYSDYPAQIDLLIDPIIKGQAEFVIGSRALGIKEKGSMTPQQIFGNWLASFLMKILYGIRYTDLGPFRAIKYSSLLELDMKDKNYGWTVEMQIKAAKKNLKIMEVPIDYRKRIGVSKVSGTLKGTIMAGYKIILTIFRYL